MIKLGKRTIVCKCGNPDCQGLGPIRSHGIPARDSARKPACTCEKCKR